MGGPPIAISGENGVVPFEEHRFRKKTFLVTTPVSYYSAYLPKDLASIGSRTRVGVLSEKGTGNFTLIRYFTVKSFA